MLKTVESLYAKKDFDGALKILRDHRSEISDGLWHYNMGTVYAGKSDLPLARFHFLEAERSGFVSKEVSQNLDIVEAKLETTRLEKPLGPSDFLVKGSLFVSDGLLTTLALVVLVFGIFNLRKEKSFKNMGIIAGIVLVILGVNGWIRSWPQVVVTVPQAIHDGPSAIFNATEELPAGVLLVTRRESDWVKIIYPSRFQGWIKNTGLKELK